MRFCSLSEAFPGILASGDIDKKGPIKYNVIESPVMQSAAALTSNYNYTDNKAEVAKKSMYVPAEESLYLDLSANSIKNVVASPDLPDEPTTEPINPAYKESFSSSNNGAKETKKCDDCLAHYRRCGFCQKIMSQIYGEGDNNLFMIILIVILIWILLRK